MSAEVQAPPAAKSSFGKKLVLAAVSLVCVAAGVALPMVVPLPGLNKEKAGGHGAKDKHAAEAATAVVPFGDVTVNLAEERMNRYLRLKVALVVEADAEKTVEEELTKKKAVIKSRLLGHLAGKTLKDVSGTAGVNRLQREILERIDDVLFPDGHSTIKGVVFEEYTVQ